MRKHLEDAQEEDRADEIVDQSSLIERYHQLEETNRNRLVWAEGMRGR